MLANRETDKMFAVSDFYGSLPIRTEFPHGEIWSIGDQPTVSVLLEKRYHEERAPRILDDMTYGPNPTAGPSGSVTASTGASPWTTSSKNSPSATAASSKQVFTHRTKQTGDGNFCRFRSVFLCAGSAGRESVVTAWILAPPARRGRRGAAPRAFCHSPPRSSAAPCPWPAPRSQRRAAPWR
jgi:hypothetical protein